MATQSGTSRAHRRQVVVASAIVAGGIALGSVAWACAPSNDTRTLIQSCTSPTGSTKACKPPLGQPVFPSATTVKGPSGASLVAYVNGPGMQSGLAYDLLFLGKPLVDAGTSCASSAATVISAGPGNVSTSNNISPTAGTIPANSPLGGGQICFSDKARSVSSSSPAIFKVTI